jgi:hypothetical protein
MDEVLSGLSSTAVVSFIALGLFVGVVAFRMHKSKKESDASRTEPTGSSKRQTKQK